MPSDIALAISGGKDSRVRSLTAAPPRETNPSAPAPCEKSLPNGCESATANCCVAALQASVVVRQMAPLVPCFVLDMVPWLTCFGLSGWVGTGGGTKWISFFFFLRENGSVFSFFFRENGSVFLVCL